MSGGGGGGLRGGHRYNWLEGGEWAGRCVWEGGGVVWGLRGGGQLGEGGGILKGGVIGNSWALDGTVGGGGSHVAC